jgi:hypothetical protein
MLAVFNLQTAASVVQYGERLSFLCAEASASDDAAALALDADGASLTAALTDCALHRFCMYSALIPPCLSYSHQPCLTPVLPHLQLWTATPTGMSRSHGCTAPLPTIDI